MKDISRFILVAVLLSGMGSAVHGQGPSSGSGAIEVRQAGFKALGRSAKIVTVALRRPEPDRAQLTAETAKVLALSRQAGSWFPKGSGPGTGVATEAQEAIWLDRPKFAQMLTQFQMATGRAAQAARAGNISAFKSEWKTVAASCKSCHDSFRSN